MNWITLKTTSTRWEAELMQQLLAAHNIPTRILDLGIVCYFGMGASAALQVHPEDRWSHTATIKSGRGGAMKV